MSDNYPNKDEDMALVRKHLDLLSEHFDTVQIFCTRYNPNKTTDSDEDGTTSRVNMGIGNFFARYGLVAYWLEHEKPRAEGTDIDPQ